MKKTNFKELLDYNIFCHEHRRRHKCTVSLNTSKWRGSSFFRLYLALSFQHLDPSWYIPVSFLLSKSCHDCQGNTAWLYFYFIYIFYSFSSAFHINTSNFRYYNKLKIITCTLWQLIINKQIYIILLIIVEKIEYNL